MSDALQATRQEIADRARQDYNYAAKGSPYWNPVIPEAIDAWEREPLLQQEVESLIEELADAKAEIMALKRRRREE